LDLKTFDGKEFNGLVQDAESLDSLPFVTVQVVFSDSSIRKVVTDERGSFKMDNISYAQHMSVSFVGYRELEIDLRELIKVRQ
jgi:hypothetical protein